MILHSAYHTNILNSFPSESKKGEVATISEALLVQDVPGR